jgi:PHD/YefM family antitoxin component YafN of YafNO toxin-antitoxin module
VRAPTSGQDRPHTTVSDGAQRHTGAPLGSYGHVSERSLEAAIPLIEQVNDPQEPMETVSKADTTYLVSADEWRSVETARLPQSPRPTPSACPQHRRRRSRPHHSLGTDQPPARRHVKINITRDGWENYNLPS